MKLWPRVRFEPAGIDESLSMAFLVLVERLTPFEPIDSGRLGRDDESGVQINPNRQQLGTEEADRSGIAGAPWRLIREPALTLAWIIV